MSDGQLIEPPYDMAAEQSVIGSLLIDNTAVDRVIGAVSEADFFRTGHRLLWRTLLAMIDANQPADVVTVAEALEKAGNIDEVGGLAYLINLHQNTPSSANIRRYAEIVREKSVRRSLMVALSDIGESVHTGASIGEVLADAQARIMAIGERTETRHPVAVVTICRDRLNVLGERFEGNDDGLDTGLIDLDDKMGRIRPGDLTVIAGRPSMGKSAFAMQLLEHMAVKTGKPGLFFSLEMTAGQLVDRLLSSAGKVNLKKFRTANFDDHDWAGLASAVGTLDAMPVYIDDHSHTLSQILSTARAFKRQHGGLSAIAVDYIGLVSTEADNREQEIAKITRALKLAAKQIGCPMLALSQLNRKLEDRTNKRPQMADLRESGAIEQDADQILMLYRDEVYNHDTQDNGICEVLIRKNRHGETGMVPTVFNGDVVKFSNFTGQYQPPTNDKPYRKTRRDL